MAWDPFFSTNPMVESMEAHRGRVEQTRENTARLASAFATYSTEGDGEFVLDEPYLFGCTFTERPIVAYGFTLDHGVNEDPLLPGKLPQATGGVRKWIRDTREFYVGAYVFFAVNTSAVARTTPLADGEVSEVVDPTADTPVYKIAHDFTFTGIAIKDLPEHLFDPAAGL